MLFCLYSGYRLAAAILWLLPSPFPSVQRKQIYTDMSESNANCWPKSVAFLLLIINTALLPPLSLLIRFLLIPSFLNAQVKKKQSSSGQRSAGHGHWHDTSPAPERNVGVIKQTEDRYRSKERWTTGEGLRMRRNFRFQQENSTTWRYVVYFTR